MTYNIDFTINIPTPPHSEYNGLKFKSIGNTTVSLNNSNSNAPDIKYSLDEGNTWIQWDYSEISLLDGDIICFKGNNPDGFSKRVEQSSSSTAYTVKRSKFVFGGSGTIDASGNIMSLIDDGECKTLNIPNLYCFGELFSGCTTLITGPELPEVILKTYCYYKMFYNCSSLISVQGIILNAGESSCYQMFYHCSLLTTIPNITVTGELDCCYGMFNGCTSLTTALNIIISGNIRERACQGMFYNCTSLTIPPKITGLVLANAKNCFYQMFYNCSSLVTAPEFGTKSNQLPLYCCYQMFYNCTSLTTAPELTALTPSSYCYYQMFYGCANLNYIKCLISSFRAGVRLATTEWVKDIAESGIFVKNSNAITTWTTGVNGIPSGWTVVNA